MMRRVKILTCALMVLCLVCASTRETSGQRLNNPIPVSAPSTERIEEPTEVPQVAVGRETVEISVYESRPLAAVVRQLRYKLGESISYEDVQWVHPEDIVRASQVLDPRVAGLRDPDMPVPAARSIQVRFDVDRNTRQPLESVEAILEGVLTQYNRGQSSSEFRLVDVGDGAGFSVAPSTTRNIDGSVMDARSPFDARISFPEEQRTGDENLDAIVGAISSATGERVMRFSGLPLRSVSLGAQNEVARVVLDRLLRESYDWKAYWHLYYDPAEGNWGLNLGAVYVETGATTTDGKPEIRPVRLSDAFVPVVESDN